MNSVRRIRGDYVLIASIFSFLIIAASLVNFAYAQSIHSEEPYSLSSK
jgi:hypothetical protein